MKLPGTERPGKDLDTVSYDSRMFPSVGRIYVAATPQGICRISLPAHPVEHFFKTVLEKYNPRIFIENNKLFDYLYIQFEEYLSGRRAVFSCPSGPPGDPFSIRGLGGPGSDPLWGDPQLRRDCPTDRASQSGPGHWPGQSGQPGAHPYPLPPGHRCSGRAGRLRRGDPLEETPAGLGKKISLQLPVDPVIILLIV